MRLIVSSLLLLLLSISVWGEMDECGRSNHPSNETLIPDKLGRIIGGSNSLLGKWPWQVKLRSVNSDGFKHLCGGSIIADRWILTAAHCLADKRIHSIEYGSVKSSDESKIASAKQHPFIVHAKYEGYQPLNDIALIELDEPITFDDTASPVCLPSINTPIPRDAQVVATGYGATDENSRVTSTELQEVVVPLSFDACSQIYEADDTHICAPSSNGQGIGGGDSGGPVVIYSKSGKWFQIGISSQTIEIKELRDLESVTVEMITDSTDVFTNVHKYCDWIEKNTRGEAKCRDGGELIDATTA